jgi:hypothetical protein
LIPRRSESRIAVAPAQEVDEVERLDLTEQLAAAVLFGALERLLEQRERLEPRFQIRRTIGDFADPDNNGNAIV